MLQGLNWYTDKLKQDRDGDVADEFLQEQTKQDGQSQQHFLHVRSCVSADLSCMLALLSIGLPVQKQKRHLRPPKDPIVFVEAGNVYVIPSRS